MPKSNEAGSHWVLTFRRRNERSGTEDKSRRVGPDSEVSRPAVLRKFDASSSFTATFRPLHAGYWSAESREHRGETAGLPLSSSGFSVILPRGRAREVLSQGVCPRDTNRVSGSCPSDTTWFRVREQIVVVEHYRMSFSKACFVLFRRTRCSTQGIDALSGSPGITGVNRS